MKKTLIALALTVAAGPALASAEIESAKFSYLHAVECGIKIGQDDGEFWIGKAQGDSENTAVPVTFVNNTLGQGADLTPKYRAHSFSHTGSPNISGNYIAAVYLKPSGQLIGSAPDADFGINVLKNKPTAVGDFRTFKNDKKYNWNTPYLLQLHINNFEKSELKGGAEIKGEVALLISC